MDLGSMFKPSIEILRRIDTPQTLIMLNIFNQIPEKLQKKIRDSEAFKCTYDTAEISLNVEMGYTTIYKHEGCYRGPEFCKAKKLRIVKNEHEHVNFIELFSVTPNEIHDIDFLSDCSMADVFAEYTALIGDGRNQIPGFKFTLGSRTDKNAHKQLIVGCYNREPVAVYKEYKFDYNEIMGIAPQEQSR